MMQKIIIVTSVDITATGIRRKTDESDWFIKRNQQRNYDMLLQVIGLRCQPMDVDLVIEDPIQTSDNTLTKSWVLSFSVERADVLGKHGELFLADIDGVPIMTGLTETTPSFPMQFIAKGPLKNIGITVIDSYNK